MHPTPGRRVLGRIDSRGVAAVEFAMIAPILISLLGAAVDLGRGIQQGIRLETAARVGAQFVTLKPEATMSEISTTVLSALSGVSGVVVSPGSSNVCLCPDSTGAITGTPSAATCSTVCTTGLARFRTITVRASFSPIFPTSQYVPWNALGTISRDVTARI
jgi:Flp pilus assembly protein TadG